MEDSDNPLAQQVKKTAVLRKALVAEQELRCGVSHAAGVAR
jgi:hypothetical protein